MKLKILNNYKIYKLIIYKFYNLLHNAFIIYKYKIQKL